MIERKFDIPDPGFEDIAGCDAKDEDQGEEDGDLRRDMPLAQAARSCAEALGRPDRIVEWGAGR